jgi:hypothetical protein
MSLACDPDGVSELRVFLVGAAILGQSERGILRTTIPPRDRSIYTKFYGLCHCMHGPLPPGCLVNSRISKRRWINLSNDILIDRGNITRFANVAIAMIGLIERISAKLFGFPTNRGTRIEERTLYFCWHTHTTHTQLSTYTRPTENQNLAWAKPVPAINGSAFRRFRRGCPLPCASSDQCSRLKKRLSLRSARDPSLRRKNRAIRPPVTPLTVQRQVPMTTK